MTKENLKEASGRGDREDLFEGGCPELSKVERCSASNCRRNVVNPAISGKGKSWIKIELLKLLLYFH